jgi:hypothetical protein
MVASRETLQDLAAERQLQPATLERVIRLIDILDAFGADTLIGPRIALKGGTALNVFFPIWTASRSISMSTMSARSRRNGWIATARDWMTGSSG